VCGEQQNVSQKDIAKKGSPPRVRGAVLNGISDKLEKRITPACAGSRAEVSLDAALDKDHPRVCGEQTRLAV